jgi:hypothetical protein
MVHPRPPVGKLIYTPERFLSIILHKNFTQTWRICPVRVTVVAGREKLGLDESEPRVDENVRT